jgi:hypothetical protein
MMKHIHLILLVGTLVLTGCKDPKVTDNELAKVVVDKAIDKVGGEQFKSASIDFDFRDRHYKATRDRWKFQFERIWKDSVNNYRDLISNEGYQRYINDSLVKVPDSMAAKYSRSINAVHYFSILPYGLNDKAVNKSYLGEVEIKAKPYNKIKITFDKDGGGEGHEDIFVYWIHKDTYQVDYFGYAYDEGPHDRGIRFREAYNRREVNGLSFTDYNNFNPEDSLASVYSLDSLFVANKLKLLSKIELEDIKVNLLPVPDH